jgi:Fur family peroxide stress response transcriptional regulator
MVTGSHSRQHQLVERFRAEGRRLTPQRLAVFRVLACSEDHPSVEQIHQRVKQQLPTTSLATVYDIVALLEELGEALALSFADGANHYDGRRPFPHPHVICVQCGTIADLDLAAADQLRQDAESRTGYRISRHRLDFFGVCPHCQEAQAEHRHTNTNQPADE